MKGVEKPGKKREAVDRKVYMQGYEQKRARKFNATWTRYSKCAPRIYYGRSKLAIKGHTWLPGF